MNGTATIDHRRTATVAGEVDAATVDLMVASVRSLPAGDRHLDATGVSFAASAALGALVLLDRECVDQGGRLTITPSPALRRIAALAGLDGPLSFV